MEEEEGKDLSDVEREKKMQEMSHGQRRDDHREKVQWGDRLTDGGEGGCGAVMM